MSLLEARIVFPKLICDICKNIEITKLPKGTRVGFCDKCARIFCLDCVVEHLKDGKCDVCGKKLLKNEIELTFPVFSMKKVGHF